ncbi:MAG: N-6 DNA methylase [Symplocastrum torsivum CPER-KK1]|uniref:site-specific DNA-methyltransferase (adenine-specific) n=1 Tax=Symplocastrum torsivum CPER-KK1 TaxID=450513 RepID=A0A951UDJ6_9CYAN|nr:N-6 DNA methylase [Symplocastrum torsivum CPER-KK1]
MLEASAEKWSKVEPAIFGTLFEGSMGKKERHALGAHFTSEADIQKVVLPTIVRPWRERIEAASTLKELLALRQELNQFKVLDSACGSGNFLYVAYRELKRLEALLLAKIHEKFSDRTAAQIGTLSLISIKQFYGIDRKQFAVELAKVTLMVAKKLALDEENKLLDIAQMSLPLELDRALPLDNLDKNIICDDALFCNWEPVDAIIGNPPYQSKNKMQQEFGEAYVRKVRSKYDAVPGRADYCVYWFRRAHDELKPSGRAGLVGTNSIRQNYSREGGLDYIVASNGIITEAVSNQVWSGDAVVHVSIVNWIKGEQTGKKKLYTQFGDNKDSPWKVVELDQINSSLSANFDVSKAKRIQANAKSCICYQGQTHGHEGFLLSPDEAKKLDNDKLARAALHPYLIGNDLLKRPDSLPSRFVIDLNICSDIFSAMRYGAAFEHVQKYVMPAMKANADEEREETGKEVCPRQLHFRYWWKFWRGRLEMLNNLVTLPRYVACSRHIKRSIFEFIHREIHPNDALQVFLVADDYSFGILQSDIHWVWFVERGSTVKRDPRYTSETVFDTFPFPQSPKLSQVKKVAAAAVKLRQLRRKVMSENQWSLRDLYRTLDLPGDNPLRKAHAELDAAVREAYGMKANGDSLQFLLNLNFEVAERETQGLAVVAPGLPPCVTEASEFITDDCVKMPE